MRMSTDEVSGAPVSGVEDVLPATTVVDADAASSGSRARSILRWLARGTWAVADQGLFAASNFILNIGLARSLAPREYGAFTLGYTIFLLFSTGHTALLTEPMLVFGAGRYRAQTPDYIGAVLHGHWVLTTLAGLLLLAGGGIAAVVGGEHTLAATLIALAFACPLILFQWLMRRACYVHLRPRLAAQAGTWYVVLLLGGGYLLYRQQALTSATAIALMAAGSLGSAIWIVVRLRVPVHPKSGARALYRDAVREHWQYGRWVIGSGVFSWIPQGIYYLLLPLRGGLESTAALKALMNLTMPVLHAYLPLATLMVPALVRTRGHASFWRTVWLALLFSVLASLVYWLLLGLANRPLVALLYGGQYLQDAHLLWLLGLIPITGAGVGVMGSTLRALERPDRIFWAYVLSSAISLTVGLGLMLLIGLPGAAAGIVLSSLTTAVVMSWSVWRHDRRREPANTNRSPHVEAH
jgi:O-antigen/teichoic acid export membrane protein